MSRVYIVFDYTDSKMLKCHISNQDVMTNKGLTENDIIEHVKPVVGSYSAGWIDLNTILPQEMVDIEDEPCYEPYKSVFTGKELYIK